MRSLRFPKLSWRSLLVWVVLLAVGGAAGYLLGAHKASTVNIKSVRLSGYQLVSPPLYTEVPEDLATSKYADLHKSIADYIQQSIGKNDATDVGVYFRDLNEGEWIGVNEAHTFAPGSMIKVATLMTVLRLTNAQPDRLSTPLHLVFGSNYDSGPQEYFPPQEPIQLGGTYTVDELLNHLIVQSDNRAADALEYYFGVNELQKTLTDLNVPTPETATEQDVSPQEYSHIFRVLYNGTYLTPSLSEQALSLLSKTNFTVGLVAGVPAGTTVAHKFGERTLPPDASTTGSAGINELHDCGIVYYPSHPYFLCVMTKGTDFPTLANVIKNISSITWQGVSARYK